MFSPSFLQHIPAELEAQKPNINHNLEQGAWSRHEIKQFQAEIQRDHKPNDGETRLPDL